MYHVLIADDESIECHVLSLMIKNHFQNLTVLPHALNGLELIAGIEKYHPEIVIVDINMPGLNGLEALEMVRQKNKNMKILIVSAYSEFHYAKRAMNLDATDYILKPVQPDDFIEAIRRICDDLNTERLQKDQEQKHQEIILEFGQVVEEDFMSNLILGEISPKNAMRLLQSLDFPYRGGILMTLRPTPSSDPLLSFPSEIYAASLLENSLLENIKPFCTCFGKQYHRDFIICLIPGMSFEKNFYKEWVQEIFQVALQRTAAVSEYIWGVSSVKLNINELVDALRESMLALHQKTVPGLYFFESPASACSADPYQEFLEPCLHLLKNRNIHGCMEKINAVFFPDPCVPESLAFFKMRTSYFLFRLNQAFLPPLSDTELSHDSWIFFWDLISGCESREEIRKKAEEGLKCIAEQKAFWNPPENPHIARCLLYMKRHYMEDLSLDLIAGMANISPFYLSRLFKQELNRNFLEILTDIRIQKAIELLADCTLSVKEISERVGYLNTTYFYKIFKKYVGINIREAKEYLQNYHIPRLL